MMYYIQRLAETTFAVGCICTIIPFGSHQCLSSIHPKAVSGLWIAECIKVCSDSWQLYS